MVPSTGQHSRLGSCDSDVASACAADSNFFFTPITSPPPTPARSLRTEASDSTSFANPARQPAHPFTRCQRATHVHRTAAMPLSTSPRTRHERVRVRAQTRVLTFCTLLGLDVGCQRLHLRIPSIIGSEWARSSGARARTRPGRHALTAAGSAFFEHAARWRERTHSPPPCARPCAWYHPARTRGVRRSPGGTYRCRHRDKARLRTATAAPNAVHARCAHPRGPRRGARAPTAPHRDRAPGGCKRKLTAGRKLTPCCQRAHARARRRLAFTSPRVPACQLLAGFGCHPFFTVFGS